MCPLSCAPQHHAQSTERTVLNSCPICKTKFLNTAYLCFYPLDKCLVLSTYYGEFSKYFYTSKVTNKAETFTKLICS